jgi:hypothetical protein
MKQISFFFQYKVHPSLKRYMQNWTGPKLGFTLKEKKNASGNLEKLPFLTKL